MRKLCTLLLYFLLVKGYLLGQTLYQQGLTREINSNKRPLPGVFIKFFNAPSTASGDDGRFELAFENHKPGDPVFMEEIRKSGYELINEKEVQSAKITNTRHLATDIILAKTGYVEAAKKEYYDISDRNLKDRFHKERLYLLTKLKDADTDKIKIQTALQNLQEQFENQRESLFELSDRFARTNFDDVDTLYQVALKLFKAGDVAGAIAKLETANLQDRTAKIIEEQNKLIALQQELDERNAILEQEKQRQIAAIRLLADMYSVNFNPQKAEAQYDDLLKLDSTDFNILKEAANFYQTQHRYAKAERLFRKLLHHPDAEDWEIANTYVSIGHLNRDKGKKSAEIASYQKFFEFYQEKLLLYPEYPSYRYNFSLANSFLGNTHLRSKNAGKALEYYRENSRLMAELHQAYPDHLPYKVNLAISFESMGVAFIQLGNLDSTLEYFEEDYRLSLELNQDFPDNSAYQHGLGICYSKLGTIYEKLGNITKAEESYQQFHKIVQTLYQAQPENINYQLDLSISFSFLGSVAMKSSNLNQAEKYTAQYLEKIKALHLEYPENVKFKYFLSIAQTKIGTIYTELNQPEKAIFHFEENLRLSKELLEADPDNIEYKDALAVAYGDLGTYYSFQENYPVALDFYLEGLRLREEFSDQYPENFKIQEDLRLEYQHVGFAYDNLNQPSKAFPYLTKAIESGEKLSALSPLNMNLKNEVSFSYLRMGDHYARQKLYEKACIYYEKYRNLVEEFHHTAPENPGHISNISYALIRLAGFHADMGDLEKATALYKQRLTILSEFCELFPARPESRNNLAIAHSQIAIFYQNEVKDLSLAKTHLIICKDTWEDLSTRFPDSSEYKGNLTWTEESLAYWEDLFTNHLYDQIDSSKDTVELYQLYGELCGNLRNRIPERPDLSPYLAEALNSRAWFGLFLGKFTQSERDIEEGLKITPEDPYLISNLPWVFLFQGKYEEAKNAILKYMDQQFEEGPRKFKDVFLEDLQTLAKKRVIPESCQEQSNQILLLLQDK